MREIGKYTPGEIESKWYSHWLDNKYFHAEVSDKEPYTISRRQMSQVYFTRDMLNNTVQDVLFAARMLGLNACWVPVLTMRHCNEAKVVNACANRALKVRLFRIS